MKRYFWFLVLGSLAMWLGMPDTAAANGRDHIVTGNLVKNPSFEDVQISSTFDYIRIPGWTVKNTEEAEVHRGFGGVTAFEGTQWIELDYLTNSYIYQDLLTVPGQSYWVSFAYANRPGQTSSAVDMYWNDSRIVRATRNLTSFERTGWYNLQATSRTTRILFAAAGVSNGAGDWLDLVVVVPQHGMILPQFADGGGWKTSITYTNPTTIVQTVTARVYGSSGSQEPSLSHSVRLGPNETRTWESPGTGSSVRAGWVSISTDADVSVTCRFRQSVPGEPTLEAAVPVRVPSGRLVAAFDNTNGFNTGIALANPGLEAIALQFRFRNEAGAIVSTRQVALAPNNHTAFFLGDQFPELRGLKGSVEITTSNPSYEFSAVGLLFTPAGTFTTLPY